MQQLSLFEAVLEAYAEVGEADNEAIYREVGWRAGLAQEVVERRTPVGAAGVPRSPVKRAIRWQQQTMKRMGLLERAERGVWRITKAGRARTPLRAIRGGHVLLAWSTRLGMALWGQAETVLGRLDRPISLSLSSPMYPVREGRGYGRIADREYVDWICRVLEPIVARLEPGGSIVLNLGNDVFQERSPARSSYMERLVVALEDRLGLEKMDLMPWVNRSKPPAPVQYASKQRVQLNSGWEAVYWFTNDPHRVRSDNRRVLEAHTERHRKLMGQGGTRRHADYGDGAYRLRPGAFGRETEGKIPKNVLEMGHTCAYRNRVRAAAKRLGLPAHGAAFPLRLALFLVAFLTERGDFVVDQMAGTVTLGMACELLGREWMAVDVIWEYLRMGGEVAQEEGMLTEWGQGFLAVA